MAKIFHFDNTYGLKRFIKSMRDCRRAGYKKDHYIKPYVLFAVDTEIFCLLPTIDWQPWIHRYDGSFVVEIRWLFFAVGIGKWERKEKNYG